MLAQTSPGCAFEKASIDEAYIDVTQLAVSAQNCRHPYVQHLATCCGFSCIQSSAVCQLCLVLFGPAQPAHEFATHVQSPGLHFVGSCNFTHGLPLFPMGSLCVTDDGHPLYACVCCPMASGW
jgi:hypothetical protein